MPFEIDDPFNGDAPATVRLPDTPLTGVLSQVRFPEVLSISNPSYIADFQEQIRGDFPVSGQETNVSIRLGADGPQQTSVKIWRFEDRESQWRVTLATSFIAIETRAYESRDDFVKRLKRVLGALQGTVNPALVGRVGVRYVDRVYGDGLDRIAEFVRPEVLGVVSETAQSAIVRSMNEALCSTREGSLLARWGVMPKDHTHDPDMMPPINQRSWFLDIDSFREEPKFTDFDADEIGALAHALATRSYAFFRWAVTEELLRHYGGEL